MSRQKTLRDQFARDAWHEHSLVLTANGRTIPVLGRCSTCNGRLYVQQEAASGLCVTHGGMKGAA